MKIIITGLPYFGKKMSASLAENDSGNKYIFLNTYYSNYDRLRFLFHILTAKVVYTINGTTGKSFVLSIAIRLKKRVVFHWVGTDVLLAKKAIEEGKTDKRFLNYPVHLTDSPWFVDELHQIGIEAKYTPLLVVENIPSRRNLPSEFSVLVYIPQADQEFYGLSTLIKVAKKLPDISFKIAGSVKSDLPVSGNIKFLGWVKNMNPLFQISTVTIRFLKHDGLSFFVLESLLNECHVIYNYEFNNCLKATDSDQIYNHVCELFEKFKKNELTLNREGREFVIREFTKENILILSKILTSL